MPERQTRELVRMEHSWEFRKTPAGKVLRVIQRRGRANIKEVAADLGVTASAVRLHLAPLLARGVVRAEKVHDGVGRPHHSYSVTPEAYALLSPEYGDLARLLFDEIARGRSPAELNAVLGRLAEGLAAPYRAQVSGYQHLVSRVAAWSELLDRRGVVVQVEEGDGRYVVREAGCLYRSVAVKSRAVCEMERQVMASLLGSEVDLDQCVLDGYDDCRFTVVSDRSAAQSTTGKEELG